MKSFVFFAAMALVLVGCNKEKEESMESAAVSTEQQQQALPVVSNNAIPAAAPAASMPEQGNVNVIGQQVAIPQAPQEAAAIPSQQAAPTVDLQNQAQPIQPSQLVQAAPVESVTTTTTTTTQEPVAPVDSVPVAIPPVAQGGAVSGYTECARSAAESC